MSPAHGGGRDSLPSMLAAAADRFGESPAIIDGETRFTYTELLEESRRFGAALVASGIERHDRVAIWAHNSAEWVLAVLGIFQAGAVLVPVNTRYKGAEAADILSRSRAKALVTETDFLGVDYVSMLRDTGAELPDLATIVIAGGPASVGTESWDGFVARATEAPRAEVDRRSAVASPDDPSDILFTSGTTGVPKGVVQTHGRTLFVATDWVGHDRAGPRRPVPHGQPVLPHVRVEGRDPGCGVCRCDHAARGGVRRRPRALDGGEGGRDRIARSAHVVSGHPGPSRPGPPRPVDAAGGRHRRRRHSRRAHSSAPRRAPVLDHRHRLRAHRRGHRGGDLTR